MALLLGLLVEVARAVEVYCGGRGETKLLIVVVPLKNAYV